MQKEIGLLVLYRKKKGPQFWCIYWGGTEEADEELKLHREQGPVEVGRIEVEEIVEYKKVIK